MSSEKYDVKSVVRPRSGGHDPRSVKIDPPGGGNAMTPSKPVPKGAAKKA